MHIMRDTGPNTAMGGRIVKDSRLDQIMSLANEGRHLATDLADELLPQQHDERFLVISARLHLLQAVKAVQQLQARS